MNNRDSTTTVRPRIVHVLDINTAMMILQAIDIDPLLFGSVVLDSDGNLLRFGRASIGELQRSWHCLPFPPLPEGMAPYNREN